MARLGFANGLFDTDIEDTLDVVDAFYQGTNLNQPLIQEDIYNIQRDLKGSVTALN